MDDLGLVTIEVAMISGTVAAEMNRHGLLNEQAKIAIGGSLKRLAEKLDVMDDPNVASVQLNGLANAILG